MGRLIRNALIAWAVILLLAIANGALREAVLIPALGRTAALALSGTLLSGLVVLVAYLLLRFSRGFPVSEGFLIGGIWLVLTLLFEFSFGRLVQHKTWPELFEAYTFKVGNIWPLVLLTVLCAPPLVVRLHGQSRGSNGDA